MTGALTTKATVVVVARNAEATIGLCMRALALQTCKPHEVILVDDGSTDTTAETAMAAYQDLRLISNPSRSISSNRNVGWRSANTGYVAFIDADCEAPATWLEKLLAAATRTGAAAVGGGNVPPGGQSAHYDALSIMLASVWGSRGTLQGKPPEIESAVPHIPTLNVLYRKDALERIGGFDERFARIGEDEDISRRLRDTGQSLVAISDAVVIHHQRSDLGSWARNMYTYGKGRTWLIRRHPNAYSPVFLGPKLVPLVLPLYLVAIALLALALCLRAGRPALWPRLTALFAATHLPYGLGQIAGHFVHGDNAAAQRKRARVGMLALKNAGNKGDEAIVCAVSERIEKLQSGSGDAFDPYLIAFGPSGFDVRPLPKEQAAREQVILDALAPADTSRMIQPREFVIDALRGLVVFTGFRAIFISGGQWLHDLSMAKHIVVCSLFAVGRLFQTRTGVFCVGVGPLKRGVSRWLTRQALGRHSLVITRDDASTALLHRSGLAHAGTAADPALLLPTTAVETPKGRILISVCAWANFENIYAQDPKRIEESLQNWSTLVDRLIAQGHDLAMLPTMNPEDRGFAEQIVQKTGHNIPCIATEDLLPSQVQGHIAEAAALISMRLHPAIFANNTGTPFVALNYAAKVHAFCEKAGLADRVVELSDTDWSNTVLEKLGAKPEDPNRAVAARAAQLEALQNGYQRLEQWLASLNETRETASGKDETQCASLS